MAFFQIDNAENDAIDMHEFGLVFSHAAIGIIVSDGQGIIININKYVENQFGYERNELLGKRIEILVPKEYHFLHKNDRRDFYAHPMPRQMGEGRNLLAVRKDGSMFSVEISLSPQCH